MRNTGLPEHLKNQLAPRSGMLEKPFRQYEPYIAQACKGSYTLHTMEEPRPKKAHSFRVGFQEAVKGFLRFRYSSRLIPQEWQEDYMLDRIKLFCLEGEKCYISNSYADRRAQAELMVSGKLAQVVVRNGKVVEYRGKEQPQTRLVLNWEELPHQQQIRKFMHDMNEGKISGFKDVIVVVFCKDQDVKEEIERYRVANDLHAIGMEECDPPEYLWIS